LLISLLLFLQPTKVLFAGSTMTYASNTLKLAIHIKDWPFATLANSLVIGFPITQLLLIFGQCGNEHNQTESGSDKQGSLRWFTI